MLASTMQFSNNQPSPTKPPGHIRNSTRLVSCTEANSRSLRTQQRARQATSKTTFHAEAVLASHQGLNRIANVPPMSNRHRTLADEPASDRKAVRSAP